MFGRLRSLFSAIILVFIFNTVAFSQSADLIWNPQFSYSWKSSDRLAYNAKFNLFNSLNSQTTEEFLQFAESQISFAYSSSTRLKLGMGYYYRLSTPFLNGYQYEHRFLQQAGLLTFFGDRRISHRLRNELRFRDSNFQLRIRYRIGYDFPLIGEKLDVGEQYLILKNEFLGAFSEGSASGENRLSIGHGWLLSRKQKFEVGLEYRTRSLFTENGIRHLFLLSTTFYLNR